jgi:hypothetical protein
MKRRSSDGHLPCGPAIGEILALMGKEERGLYYNLMLRGRVLNEVEQT